MLGWVGGVNVNRWPSHSVSVCLAGSFAIQISDATLSKCFLVVLPLLLYRAAYRVSGLSFSCFLKHPGWYKRGDYRHVCSLSSRHIRWWRVSQFLTPLSYLSSHFSLFSAFSPFLPDMMSQTGPCSSRSSMHEWLLLSVSLFLWRQWLCKICVYAAPCEARDVLFNWSPIKITTRKHTSLKCARFIG